MFLNYLHCFQIQKKGASNAKSTHEELENHKNIRFQIECNDSVILANKQKGIFVFGICFKNK